MSDFRLPLGMGLSALPEQEVPARYASLDGWKSGNYAIPLALILVAIYLSL